LGVDVKQSRFHRRSPLAKFAEAFLTCILALTLMAEPSHAQSRKPTAEVAAIQDCANKDQDNSAIGQGADKIATFLVTTSSRLM
jgi:hypothetical protein